MVVVKKKRRSCAAKARETVIKRAHAQTTRELKDAKLITTSRD